MQGVRGGDGGGICGRIHDDLAWESGRGATDLEDLGHRGRAAGILNVLPGQGRSMELPGVGMPGPSGNEDGNVGSLPIPACSGHCVHYGVRKPPPPMLHPMRHSGLPAGTERQAHCHQSVRQRRGAKEAAANGGGAEGELGTGLGGIR